VIESIHFICHYIDYQPGAPNRTDTVCENSPAVDRLILRGKVYDSDCETPLANTKLDIWQADARGIYSEGKSHESNDYTCRAVIYTDEEGFYTFTTIFPGRYDDGGYRPAHIHWRITPQDASYGSLLTQLYFKMDKYLYPHDSCQDCNSQDPTLVANVTHLGTVNDIKTYEGTWNIVVSRKRSDKVIATAAKPTDKDAVGYKVKKQHLISSNKQNELERLRSELARMNQELVKWKQVANQQN
jgi:protocatechuate 3,4-dioxygenase beta subunit